MPHDARAVANYFLTKAIMDSRDLTPMQIINLVYFAHGWSLAVLDRPLLTDQVEVWKSGPIVRSVYDAFKRYGNDPITDFARHRAREGAGAEVVPDRFEEDFTHNELSLMEQVWKTYGTLLGFQLANLANQPGTPWHAAYQRRVDPDHVLLDKDIAAYFTAEGQRNRVRRQRQDATLA
jgi:uncharacterized phage-associated protein